MAAPQQERLSKVTLALEHLPYVHLTAATQRDLQANNVTTEIQLLSMDAQIV